MMIALGLLAGVVLIGLYAWSVWVAEVDYEPSERVD